MIEMRSKTYRCGSRARTGKIITQQIKDVTTTNKLKLFTENLAYQCAYQLSQKPELGCLLGNG
jgi:hypothetical protein